ncbi:MAG TPA: TOBE domain-containing protein [Fibrobacteria bacterium]|nr:TOBE domain-containing protein [Fibrobacteria bacterium]HOX51934.1 TOBE domain-containing protein [Fibrobacteria bacterium]
MNRSSAKPHPKPIPKTRSKSSLKAATRVAPPALVPVWNLQLPDGSRLGEDRILLLKAIAESGSLLSAAGRCGLSYRTAWSRVQELNGHFPEPLVLSAQGGAEGGTTHLSPQALRLVSLHEEANRLFQRTAADHGLSTAELHPLESFQRKLSMRTSVRNEYAGRILSVARGKVNAQIELELRGGSRIVSQITLASCEALGLAPGKDAWALVKSNWVEIAAGERPPRVSARNILSGTVSAIRHGEVSDEITLSLGGSESITSVVLPGELDALGLRKGSKAWALFKASSVILAVN